MVDLYPVSASLSPTLTAEWEVLGAVRHYRRMNGHAAHRGAFAWLGRMINRIIEPEENPGDAVYGTITAGALLAAEAGRRESLLDAVGAVVLAMALYWVAHAYADALGERLAGGRRLSVTQLGRHLVTASTFLRGGAIPIIVLLVSRASGAPTGTAVLAGLVAAAGTLLVLETISAARQRLNRTELLLQVSVGALLGAGVLAVRVVLH